MLVRFGKRFDLAADTKRKGLFLSSEALTFPSEIQKCALSDEGSTFILLENEGIKESDNPMYLLESRVTIQESSDSVFRISQITNAYVLQLL